MYWALYRLYLCLLALPIFDVHLKWFHFLFHLWKVNLSHCKFLAVKDALVAATSPAPLPFSISQNQAKDQALDALPHVAAMLYNSFFGLYIWIYIVKNSIV